MEYSKPALPTCYRILYYYGDFAVAPSFAYTVKERDEIDQKERRLPQAKSKDIKDVNSEVLKAFTKEVSTKNAA